MMWNRVLLVYPNVKSKLLTDRFVIPPLGLEYLKAQVNGLVYVDILDARNLALNRAGLRDRIARFGPDLVGICVNLSCGIDEGLDVARVVKQTLGGCTVILGGWHPSLMTAEVLNDPNVDAVVCGEGEATFQAIIEKQSFENVLGVSYKVDGRAVHNGSRPLIADLDRRAFPDRAYRRIKRYNIMSIPIDVVETSRGCPYTCNFCCIHEFYHHTYRTRSPLNVVRELYQIKQSGKATDILIVDDNFLVNVDHVKELCRLIIKSKLGFHFMAQIRVDAIARHPDVIELMARAGFWCFFVGIESTAPKGLSDANKGSSVSNVAGAIEVCNRNHVMIVGNVIIGVDLDGGRREVLEEIDRVRSLPIDILTFSIITPLPKTRFYGLCEEEGLFVSRKWRHYNIATPVIRTRALSAGDLGELHRIATSRTLLRRKYGAIFRRLLKTRGLRFVVVSGAKAIKHVLGFLPSLVSRTVNARATRPGYAHSHRRNVTVHAPAVPRGLPPPHSVDQTAGLAPRPEPRRRA
ncbi:MAG: cobalamin-dependent protein [Candidatus Lokiarchaeota archaeon]|nr:cobalamin-dependent protein [Candidatus Lokiarchaeota archaeon]